MNYDTTTGSYTEIEKTLSANDLMGNDSIAPYPIYYGYVRW